METEASSAVSESAMDVGDDTADGDILARLRELDRRMTVSLAENTSSRPSAFSEAASARVLSNPFLSEPDRPVSADDQRPPFDIFESLKNVSSAPELLVLGDACATFSPEQIR